MSVDSASPSIQTEPTPESVIAQVRRQLASETVHHASISSVMLEGVVERAVHELWGSRIKTFVPVLAQRQARAALHGLAAALSIPEQSAHEGAVSSPVLAGYDIVSLDGDILDLDERDVLRV